MRAEILSSGTKGRARQSGIVLGWLGLVVVLGVFSSLSARAEILYDKDGIRLRGKARIVTSNAATCHVLEESHPEARYEELTANDGQPLHVWQLDYSAHNRTGRALWYLRAEFDIESEYPPCTNWTGEGPDGGPTGSEQYSDSVFWGDQSRTLSAPAGMLRGESRQGVVYLAVFHTDQPSFERWRAYVTHSEPDKAAPVRSGTTPSEPARTPGFPLGLSDPSSDQAVADVGRPAEMFGGGSESHPRPGSGCRSNRRWWR